MFLDHSLVKIKEEKRINTDYFKELTIRKFKSKDNLKSDRNIRNTKFQNQVQDLQNIREYKELLEIQKNKLEEQELMDKKIRDLKTEQQTNMIKFKNE